MIEWLVRGRTEWKPVVSADWIPLYTREHRASKVVPADLMGCRRQREESAVRHRDVKMKLERARYVGEIAVIMATQDEMDAAQAELDTWDRRIKALTEETRIHEYFPRLGGTGVTQWCAPWQGWEHTRKMRGEGERVGPVGEYAEGQGQVGH